MIEDPNLKSPASSDGSFPTRKAQNRKFDPWRNRQCSRHQTKGSTRRHQREQCMKSQLKTSCLDL